MRTKKKCVLGLMMAVPVCGVLWACTGDDDTFRPDDAGSSSGDSQAVVDRGAPPVEGDGAPQGLACGDAGVGAPSRVLLIQGRPRQSELAVVNLQTKTVDGRLAFDGGYGVTSSLATEPYLLGGESDLVTRLDPREPWKPIASWDVRGDDAVDGGESNANPVAVVPVSCTKAYVLRFNRDRMAVIDQSQPGGGTVTRYIDLSSLKQPGDPNFIEMTAATYVPSKKQLFVLLGNSDLTKTAKINGPFGEETKLLCVASLKPTIIAIDVETDQIVNLGGTGPGGGIVLEGANPPLGVPLIYDAAADRLIVVNAGCNEDVDGGPGLTIRRRVEEVSLATKAVKTLLSLDTMGFPSSLAFVSGDTAALAFYFDGYHWDPRTTTIGKEIEGGVDIVAPDNRGAYVGTKATYYDDGGIGPLYILSIPSSPDAGGPGIVVENPFSTAGGYVAGVEAWPPR